MDKILLDIIQSDFPLEEAPYASLGKRLNLNEDEALALTLSLKTRGMIRRIGPFFDSGSLGFASTLVATAVMPKKVEDVASLINRYGEVTHNYLRGHRLNIWFTIIAQSRERIYEIISDVEKMEGVSEIHNLPARITFKVNADLSFTALKKTDKSQIIIKRGPAILDEKEKKLIRIIQNGIPLEKRPFDFIARSLDIDMEWILGKIRKWKDEGVLRRFGAALAHVQAGFKHNAMVVWSVPPIDEERLGRDFAKNHRVSHCYLRAPFEGFPYSLYTMLHSQSKEDLKKTVESLKKESGIEKYIAIESIKEFKKTSPQYF